MKLLITTLLTINCFFSFAQIEALFDLKRFQSTDQNYIETYLYIYGNTIKESLDTSNRKKSVEILQYIENKEKEIVAYKKHTISEEADYVQRDGIMDLQRFSIKDGNFNIFIEIKDQL